MSIFRLCNRYNVSLTKARRMEKSGILILNQDEEPEEEIFYWLARGQHLTVRHIVMLLEKPALVELLGSQESKAREQLSQVGPAKEDAAPPHVVACIATRNLTPESMSLLIQWIQSVLPAQAVSHYWLASRLVFGLPESIRKDASGYVRFALKRCREHPDFSGWSRPVKFMRTQTVYQRPAMMFDL